MATNVQVPQSAVTLEKTYLFGINLIHALVVGPLLMYVGYKGKEAGDFAFYTLLYAGFMVHFYHVYRLFVPRKVVELYEPPKSEWPQISKEERNVAVLATNTPGEALSNA